MSDKRTPYEFLVEIERAAPQASEDTLFDQFWSAMSGHAKKIARSWVHRNLADIRRAKSRANGSKPPSLAATLVARIRNRAKSDLLGMIFSDGHVLRDIGWHELPAYARQDESRAKFLWALYNSKQVTGNQEAKVGDVVNERETAAVANEMGYLVAA